MKLLASSAALLFVVACGGGGNVTPTNAPGRTTAPGQTSANPSTPAPVASNPVTASPAGPAPQPGSGTVAVVVTGGEHPGSYTGSENPNCTYNFFSTNTWGVQYSITGATPEQLSSVQLVYRADGSGGDDDDMFSGTSLLFTVAFGDLLDSEAYKEYTVEVRADDEEGQGTGSAEVTDNGATAVIHATGTTDDGVSLDATINCPTVTRP
jgi:hypothetical protein